MKHSSCKFKVPLLLFSLLFVSACTDNTHTTEQHIDALERQLEIGRHNQLSTLKKLTTSSLEGFTTDGCSGGLSIGWEYMAGKIDSFQTLHGTRPPWESCCTQHDKAYHPGGSPEATAIESFEARKAADLALRTCVLEAGVARAAELSSVYNITAAEVEMLYTAIAGLMYRSVRIGGMPCTGLPWRWGYGWPACE